MSNSGNFLILTAGYGAGHNQAGHAVAEALRELDPRLHVICQDYLEWIPRSVASATVDLYRWLCRSWPRGYGWVYDTTGRLQAYRWWRRVAYQLGQPRLRRWLARHMPSAIVCTHPLPMGAISLIRQAGGLTPAVVAVVTDYVLHPEWAQPHLDHYCVPTPEVAQALVAQGIPADRIEVTGIPVRPGFARPVKARAADPLPGLQVLFMTSALGTLSGVVEVCRQLWSLPLPARWVVIAGQDRALYANLTDLAHRLHKPSVQVLGWVDSVWEWMLSADLLITKAGGLTVAEALACGKPLLLLPPLPGQEAGNASWLERQGAARVARSGAEVASLAYELLSRPDQLETLAAQSRRLARPNAAFQVAQAALHLTQSPLAGLGS